MHRGRETGGGERVLGNSTSTSESESGSHAPSVTPSSSSSHWTLMVVFLSLLVDLLGFTVILPLIPSLLEYYSSKDQVRALHHFSRG